MRNAANKMTNPIDPNTENHFLSFIEISERNGSLCGSHSSSLWLSLAQKALARLTTSQLHSSSLSHSGTDMWFLALKFSHYPSRPVPLPELFVTTRPDPIPKSKTTTRQSLDVDSEDFSTVSSLWSLMLLHTTESSRRRSKRKARRKISKYSSEARCLGPDFRNPTIPLISLKSPLCS